MVQLNIRIIALYSILMKPHFKKIKKNEYTSHSTFGPSKKRSNPTILAGGKGAFEHGIRNIRKRWKEGMEQGFLNAYISLTDKKPSRIRERRIREK